MIGTSKTYSEFMQQIADDFFAATGNWRATSSDIAAWAIKQGLWQPPESLALKVCARDIAHALREEYITDDKGRSVRAKHAARMIEGSEQGTFWADIRTAPHEHIELAFQQRRKQIVGDCRQLKLDQDYYNAKHPERPHIQLCFNFEEDLEEIEALATIESPAFRNKPR